MKGLENLRSRGNRACALALALALAATPAVAQSPAATLQLTVEQAITLALEQNRGLKLRGDEVTHYQALKAEKHAGYLPKIDNSSHASYVTDLEGVVIPAGALGAATPAQTLRLDQGASASYGVGTHLLQPTTELFQVRALNRAAQADLNSARLGVDDAEESLAISVRQLFYSMQVTGKQQQAAEAAEQAVQETLRESRANQQAGASLSVDDLAYQAELLEDQQKTLKLRLTLHHDALQLADMLGAPLNSRFVLLESPGTAAPLPARAEAVQLALVKQPKVHMAEQALAKAKAQLSAAQDAYIPKVDAVATQAYQSGVPFLVHNFGVFEVKFSYDLFDGGAREAKIRDAKSGLAAAQTSLEQTREDASVAVEEAYDDVEQATEAVSLAKQTVATRAEALRLAQAQLDQGEVLASKRDQARADLLSAQASDLEAGLDLSLAQSEVLRALGQVAR